MRDLHHEPSPPTYVGRSDRRGASSRELPPSDKEWTPRRRLSDGPIALVADDVRRRLAPVCDGWSERDFEELFQQIARMKVRWMQLDRAD